MRFFIKIVTKALFIWLVILLVISIGYQAKRQGTLSEETEIQEEMTTEFVPTVGTKIEE